MRRRREPPPAWARRRARERDAERADRDEARRSALLGFGDQDPVAVAAWSKSLVRAVYGPGGFYCLACRRFAGPSAFDVQSEPETVCAGCARPISEAVA